MTLFISMPVIAAVCFADEDSYEQRVAAKLAGSIASGELLEFNVNGSSFIAIYDTPATMQPLGVIILLHSMGEHPDWPELISPLRTRLPQIGWSTLSLQLPVLPPDQPIADYGKTVDQAKIRIHSALQSLLERGYSNIVVMGHSFGAAVGVDYLADKKTDHIKAFVGISMQVPPFLNPRLDIIKRLEYIEIPVLDIYADNDLNEVLTHADDRRLAARKTGNNTYRQIIIENSAHYFTGAEDKLLFYINEWLNEVMSGRHNPSGSQSSRGTVLTDTGDKTD